MQAALPLMVAGSLVQGIAGLKAGQYSQRAAETNALGAERDGALEAARIRDQARLAMGQQIGAQAESGFTPGTGSALDSLRESAIGAELDVLNIRRKAASAAAAQRAQGKMAAQQGKMALVGSLFGAASAVAGHKADYAQLSKASGY